MLKKILILSAIAPFYFLSTTCSFAEESIALPFGKDIKKIMIHDTTCKGIIKTSDSPEVTVNVIVNNKEQAETVEIKGDSDTVHIKQNKKDTCEARLEITVPKDKQIEYNATFINAQWNIDNIYSKESELTLKGEGTSVEVNSIKADKFKTLIEGNNNTLNIKGGTIEELKSKVQGPGKAVYNVDAKSVEAEVVGNGSIGIKNITGGDASVEVKGNGNISITSGNIKKMESKVYGNGNIKYGGSADKAKNTVVGNGTINIESTKSNENEVKGGNGKIIINNQPATK